MQPASARHQQSISGWALYSVRQVCLPVCACMCACVCVAMYVHLYAGLRVEAEPALRRTCATYSLSRRTGLTWISALVFMSFTSMAPTPPTACTGSARTR